jgi:CRP-like cAMP-binding protein
MKSDGVYLYAVLAQVCRRLRETECTRAPHGDCGSRLAQILLSMSAKFGADVPLTRRELGELAGTTVETAIREIKKFERAGWVRLGRGHVRVLASAALLDRAEHRETARAR